MKLQIEHLEEQLTTSVKEVQNLHAQKHESQSKVDALNLVLGQFKTKIKQKDDTIAKIQAELLKKLTKE